VEKKKKDISTEETRTMVEEHPNGGENRLIKKKEI